jgi:GGDEF domain-containing protein
LPLSDLIRRRPQAQKCAACGAVLPTDSMFCPGCGVRTDDPDAQPLHIVDRVTGLFNDRFIRPVLEDELARAHRYGRPVGVLLVESRAANGNPEDPNPGDAEAEEQTLKQMAAAVAATLRDVDTPGVLQRHPPQLLAILPDTDISGTAHAATRVVTAVNAVFQPLDMRAGVGLVCVHHGSRLRAGAVIEAAGRSLRSGRPELLGR